MPHRSPIVLVTGPDAGGWPAWIFTRYMIWRAGGRAVRITPRRPNPPADWDALIVGGGADVWPERYGDPPLPPRVHKRRLPRRLLDWLLAPILLVVRLLFRAPKGRSRNRYDLERDELELLLIDEAERLGRPCLGICRGAQLLNIHAGGTLHSDLSGFYGEEAHPYSALPLVEVGIDDDSRLATWLGATELLVNSLHHQAIDRLGAGLRVVARDARGIVQGIEHGARPFWVGVQWHPEYMPQRHAQRRLFGRLVASA